MKGLHALRMPAPPTTWRWYSAYLTRRGRRHLFKVPLFDLDIHAWLSLQPRLPYHLRYYTESDRNAWANEQQTDGFGYIVPAQIEPTSTHAERYCNREQEARFYTYEMAPSDTTERPRGYCATCWRHYANVQPEFQETGRATPLSRLRDDIDVWRVNATAGWRPVR